MIKEEGISPPDLSCEFGNTTPAPIFLYKGKHDSRHVYQLRKTWEDVSRFASEHPQGTVVIFVEDADPQEASIADNISLMQQSGVSPAQAIKQSLFNLHYGNLIETVASFPRSILQIARTLFKYERNPKIPTVDEFWKDYQTNPDSGFITAIVNGIEDLSGNFPGRIRVVFEKSTTPVNTRDTLDDALNTLFYNYMRDGKLDDALEIMREMVGLEVEHIPLRDIAIANQLQQIAFQSGVIGVFARLGAGHCPETSMTGNGLSYETIPDRFPDGSDATISPVILLLRETISGQVTYSRFLQLSYAHWYYSNTYSVWYAIRPQDAEQYAQENADRLLDFLSDDKRCEDFTNRVKAVGIVKAIREVGM